MHDDWKWFIGLLAGIAAPAGTAILFAFRSVYQKISKGDGALHKRIDEVRDDYVKQEHLATHMDHLSQRLDGMKEDSQTRHDTLNKRMDEMKYDHARGFDEIKDALRDIKAK